MYKVTQTLYWYSRGGSLESDPLGEYTEQAYRFIQINIELHI